MNEIEELSGNVELKNNLGSKSKFYLDFNLKFF
jgi:hypothetical protein